MSYNSPVIRVFTDTTVIRHSVRERRILFSAGNGTYRRITVDPADGATGELRTEIDHLSTIAELARAKSLELFWHTETSIEYLGQKVLGRDGVSQLVAAGIRLVDGPFTCSRLLAPVWPQRRVSARQHQIDWLKRIPDGRFHQLRRLAGANQDGSHSSKQLKDAFHVWCAEASGCTHFLTTDFVLIGLLQQRSRIPPPRVKIVRPSELVSEVALP